VYRRYLTQEQRAPTWLRGPIAPMVGRGGFHFLRPTKGEIGRHMERFFMVAGALAAMIGVILGAFGAHGLRERLSPADLEIFEKGAQYQMYHALGLFAVAWAASRWPSSATTAAGWLLIVGIVVFSGSLYTLVLTGQRWLGAVTPLGGVALIAGWAALAWAILRA
jgi:uncharacterized membrane protein YgdD (TMEM256/DUF423 family)